jgi:hypothetical protein
MEFNKNNNNPTPLIKPDVQPHPIMAQRGGSRVVAAVRSKEKTPVR